MSSPELGVKRSCQACDLRYYDLNKTPIICPSCNAPFDPEVTLKSRRNKPVLTAGNTKSENEKPAEDDDVALEDDVDDSGDDKEEIIDDDSDLIGIGPNGDDSEDTLEVASSDDDTLDETEDEEELD